MKQNELIFIENYDMLVSIFGAFNFFIVFSSHKSSSRVADIPPTSQMATLKCREVT